ncbi:MAG: ABC transporter permease [Clostridium sp.]|nr:ABC transporter permease [Clostridium sp.]
MNKYIKIEIFLIIGFMVSAFTFSLTISSIYSQYSKVIEKNKFNANYKTIEVNKVEKPKQRVDGYEIVDSSDENDIFTLRECIDVVNKNGYNKIILNPMVDQIEEGNDFYVNTVWPCSAGIDIKSDSMVEGRYFTEEELSGNNKVVIIDSKMQRLTEEKEGEKYIKIFNEEYKVIGVIGETEVFKYSSIIPIKSLNCIDEELPRYIFMEYDESNKAPKEIADEDIRIIEDSIPKISVIDYLFENVIELKNNLYQIVLGIINLLLFSYFFAKGIKEKVAIMRVLGARNIHIFTDVFKKFLKIASVGIALGLLLSECTIGILRQAFEYEYSLINIQNVIITSLIILVISLVVSVIVLLNVIKFKIMKEIR